MPENQFKPFYQEIAEEVLKLNPKESADILTLLWLAYFTSRIYVPPNHRQMIRYVFAQAVCILEQSNPIDTLIYAEQHRIRVAIEKVLAAMDTQDRQDLQNKDPIYSPYCGPQCG